MSTPREGEEDQSQATQSRSSPERDYFSLSILAMKIKLAEQEKKQGDLLSRSNTEEFEMINKISERKLYRLCQ